MVRNLHFCVENMVFQGRQGADLTMVLPWGRGGPHGSAVTGNLTQGFGQRSPRGARGDPIFGCAPEEVLLFMPPYVCTRLLYPDKVSFQAFSGFYI